MTESKLKPNSNIRKKLKKRERFHAHSMRVCLCGGLERFGFAGCFRPGGSACIRRSIRKGVDMRYIRPLKVEEE